VVGGLLFNLYSFIETTAVNTVIGHYLATVSFGAMTGLIVCCIFLKNQTINSSKMKIELKEVKTLKEKFIALEKSNQDLHTLIMDDELTGLRNRRGFFTLAEKQLIRAKHEKKDIVIMFIDIDRMKWINDNCGHREGDQALRIVARILNDIFKEPDVVARIGGDEFAVLSLQSSANNMERRIDLLHLKLNEFNEKNNKGYQLSISVGIAVYEDSCSSLEEMLNTADESMYENKRRSRTSRLIG
jgi:diguanylate cyclase (GGDEF)-like protein